MNVLCIIDQLQTICSKRFENAGQILAADVVALGTCVCRHDCTQQATVNDVLVVVVVVVVVVKVVVVVVVSSSSSSSSSS